MKTHRLDIARLRVHIHTYIGVRNLRKRNPNKDLERGGKPQAAAAARL